MSSWDTAVTTPPATPSPRKASPVLSHRPRAGLALSRDSQPDGSSPAVRVPQVRQRFEEEDTQSDEGSGDGTLGSEPLAEDTFQHNHIIFDVIDQMHSLGAIELLQVPQLVIVGGQNAGKSALLQTLTGIPFPVASGCCTRFPTRIVSTRTPPGTLDKFRISINKSPFKIKGIKPAAAGYDKYERSGVKLTANEFKTIMEEVSLKLGIRRGKEQTCRNFAAEVLNVELTGPRRSHFSIVDLPGQFRNPVDVKESDVREVQEMIVKYLEQPDNIVVCVADVPTDLGHQDIPKLVNTHVEKERTIGVFTKCDMVAKSDLDMCRKAVNIGRGLQEDENLSQDGGWFFVRNRLKTDPKDFDLDAAERELFGTQPWNQVQQNRLGTTALKSHLQTVFDSKIGDCFKSLRQKILGQLESLQARKDKMGGFRKDLAEKRSYVARIVQLYRDQVEACLRHNGYQRSDIQILSKENTLWAEFDTVMRFCGGVWRFEDDPDDVPQEKKKKEARRDPSMAELIKSRRVGHAYSNVPEVNSAESLLASIGKQVTSFNAGQIPGIVNPEVFHQMYQMQVANWPRIVEIYIEQVQQATWACIEAILSDICPAEGSTRKLHEELTTTLKGYFHDSCGRLWVDCGKHCNLQTASERLCPIVDRNFEADLQKRRQRRWIDAGKSIEPTTNFEDNMVQYFQKIHWSLETNMVYDVHDVLKGYYEISLEYFLRSIKLEVSTFIEGSDSPLRRLGPNKVLEFSNEEIDRLGSEDESTLRLRVELDRDIATMENALRVVDEAREEIAGLVDGR